MKKYYLINILLLIICLSSCATSGRWTNNNSDKNTSSVLCNEIKVDKTGGGYSLENEIKDLLPLLFLEKDFLLSSDDDANFLCDIHATERDFTSGWKTKKSVSIEVILRQNTSGENNKITTPCAAGRVVTVGTQGLSSSKNLEKLLRKAVRTAINAAKRLKGNI
jgi:hypothetical protein